MSDIFTERSSPSLVLVRATMMAAERKKRLRDALNSRTGWYLRQTPVGGSNAGGLLHPSLSPFPPLSLSIPLKFTDKHGREGQTSEGGVPRLPPPTNTTLLTHKVVDDIMPLTGQYAPRT